MKKHKIPKCNGRPQLWTRVNGAYGEDEYGLRIIYPEGYVHWTNASEGTFTHYEASCDKWLPACTNGRTQEEAVTNVMEYDPDAEFLGYL